MRVLVSVYILLYTKREDFVDCLFVERRGFEHILMRLEYKIQAYVNPLYNQTYQIFIEDGENEYTVAVGTDMEIVVLFIIKVDTFNMHCRVSINGMNMCRYSIT